MASESEFVDYLVELLSPLETVHAKRMFGCYGIFKEHLMFGIVAQGELYLKADDLNRLQFEAMDLERFTYQQKDKTLDLSYYNAPDDILESSEQLCRWGQTAYEAAVRNDTSKKKKTSKIRPPEA